jgi:hypothetical protein
MARASRLHQTPKLPSPSKELLPPAIKLMLHGAQKRPVQSSNALSPHSTHVSILPSVLLCACRLTDVEITDNLLLVLLAGFDTSSTTLTAVLANLQQHPAALEQLRQEQQAVVVKHGQGLSAAVLRDMPYAEAVIRWGLASTCKAITCYPLVIKNAVLQTSHFDARVITELADNQRA